MNRRLIVIVMAVAAVILFAGAATYQQYSSDWVTENERTAAAQAPTARSKALPVKETAPPPQSDRKSVPSNPTELGPPFVRDHSPVLGPEDAPVTITEFFDPACESCRAIYPTVKKIMAAFPGKVRVVLRYATFHKQSRQAVEALEAARRQNVFVPVLEALLEWQSVWAPHGREGSGFWSFAANAGLDTAKAQEYMTKPELAALLRIEEEDIKALGVHQTPTFFVNGKPLPKLSAQHLYDLVKAEVAALQ